MMKISKKYEFENYFDSVILARGEKYYRENRIRDIIFQKNLITAYIDGSSIYRVELLFNGKELENLYCSCPYSNDGQYMCKHMAAVLYYLADNGNSSITNKKQVKQKEYKSELSKIYDEMKSRLKSISDRHGFVDYYNGRYFVDLIFDVSNYIDDFINNEEYKNAFELIKHTYKFIKNTFMDGSNGEFQESLHFITESASKLLYNDEYFDKFLDYTYKIADSNALDDFSDSPLYSFILYAHDKESAIKVIKILDDIELNSYGLFVSQTLDKISLMYEFVDKEAAIDLCYKNINGFGIKSLLIKYLKSEGQIDEVIKILKDDVKESIRKDMAYDKLLSVYEEYNMLDEMKKILPKVIVETSSFKRYKELKDMYDDSDWGPIKEKIISNIKTNNLDILEDIYMEENEVDKLFELIRKRPTLYRLAKYQDTLKDKYSKELLNFYKPLILEDSRTASDRKWYQKLCHFIKKMDMLNDSDDFIFEMLKEMYPNYKNKRAFKEEIINVLNKKNKQRFCDLIETKC